MIVELALAVGVLAPLPPAVLAPIPVLDDCARPKLIETPRPRVHKPGLVTHRKPRLFKHEPKPEEPDCGTGVLPPIFTVLTPEEPSGPFSPVPELVVIPFDMHVPDVPDVEAGPAGRAFAGDGLGLWTVPAAFASPVTVGSVAAVPEPGVWAIFAFGVLGMFGWKARDE